MTSSVIHDKGLPALGHMTAVGQRLLASLVILLALRFAWGPFCAFANLLRAEPPTVFFSPSYYLFSTTAVCLLKGPKTVPGAIVLVALTVFAWQFLGRRCHRWFLLLALLPVALLGVRQLDLASRLPESQLIAGLAWCIVSAYFGLPAVQISALPVITMYLMLQLADIADPFVMLFASLVLVYACHHYLKDGPAGLIAEALGAAAFIAIPFAVLLHVRVGHFVFALDMPYILAFVGVWGLIVGAGLMARSLIQGSSVRPAIVLIILGLVLLPGGLYWSQHPPDPPKCIAGSSDRPNIILIIWDTVRAQQLHQYGYHRKTTPTFDELAAHGALFERAIAPSCWTLPTHASMFTGLWPRTHAACSGGYLKLAQKYDTLAELLAKAGYETIGLSANHSWAGRKAGISQGFELFLEPMVSAETAARPMALLRDRFWPYDAGGRPIKRALRRWLSLRPERNKPFFLFINLFEAHYPYTPRSDLVVMSPGLQLSEVQQWGQTALEQLFVEGPTDKIRGWQGLRDLYDGEIRYVDQSTGHILGLLKSALGDDNILTVITSDHGEELGEHDLAGHEASTYDTMLHVPLVLSWPGHIPPGIRVSQTVSTTSLFATMAEATTLPKAVYASSQSASLLGIWTHDPTYELKRHVVAEVWPTPWLLNDIWQLYTYATPAGRFIAPLFALYDGDWKYIRGAGQNRELVYNIAQDPDEKHDLCAQEPERCAKMSALLDKWLQETPNNMPTFADGYEKAPLYE